MRIMCVRQTGQLAKQSLIQLDAHNIPSPAPFIESTSQSIQTISPPVLFIVASTRRFTSLASVRPFWCTTANNTLLDAYRWSSEPCGAGGGGGGGVWLADRSQLQQTSNNSQYSCLTMLAPGEPLFERVAKEFMLAQREEFGASSHLYQVHSQPTDSTSRAPWSMQAC